MKKIEVIKSGNVINLSIGGKLHKKNCGSAEEANELMRVVLSARQYPSDENIKALRCLLNEKLRIALMAGLETDPETNEVYLAGFNTPVPAKLVEVAKDYHDNGFPLDAIINFWKLLMINPDQRVRTSLFDFINTHDFSLTDKGYMIVYKAVYRTDDGQNTEGTKFAEFVSNQVLKVKKSWKESPKAYVVYRNEDGELAITAVKTAQEMINTQKAEIELQRDQLEKANITKDKFFSIIAHDLKNPFHSILGFTDLLIKNYNDFEDIKKLEFLGLINESSQYANNLLDNLLHWSRTQTDRIKYSPIKFDLHSLVNEIQHMMHGNAEKKQLALLNLVPEATYVYADKNMIHTVLRNLVSNSIKFTPEEGTISFEAVPEGDHIHVSVRDNGVGIPLNKQGKLFSFGEFHSTSGTAGELGTGLGLIICFEFIKKHTSELSFSSESGTGTTFTFNLPGQEPSVRV